MKRTMLVANLIWVALVGASFGWNYTNFKREQREIARQTARSFFDQVVISRAWNAGHGGVYVPVTKGTQPNPYLETPLREIAVDDTLTLTKVNPAFMTRQISEIAAKAKGIQFHITSLKPIRPQNRPNQMERASLERFNTGVPEVGCIFKKDGRESFFYMAPLLTTKACLKCHARQGYQEGEIRGGISVVLPFVPGIPLVALLVGHLVIGLAGAIGIAYGGRKLNNAYSVIQNQAVMDALTGIPNRRFFTDNIIKEYRRSRRDNNPLSVILCDIDKFKQYNDTYGHAQGDECLRMVAGAIHESLERPGDFCARYGGEEFVIILPNTLSEGATHVAERIREKILNLDIPHEKSPPLNKVSISIGVATADP